MLFTYLLALVPLVAAVPTAERTLQRRSRPAYNSAAPKRGIPYNDPTTYIQHFNGGQVNWAYNWNSITDSSFPHSYMEFYPMLWGPTSDHTSVWAANAQVSINSGSNHLLFFNEPDLCSTGSSCVDYVTAANDFKTYMNPFYSQAYLGGPAVSGSPAGLVYLQNFVNQCNAIGCETDFFPVHWYDSATNFAWLQSFLTQAHAICGTKNLALTEFMAYGTTAQQEAFLAQAIPWLDAQTWISHYAWFWASPNATDGSGALVLANGYQSPLGSVFTNTAF